MKMSVTQYIEKKFVIKKMKRWLAAAIAFGILFSAVYCLYFNAKYTDAFQDVSYDERLLVSNYNGNYLSYPETTRFAVWNIRVKADVMEDLSRNPSFSYKDYLHQYGDILVDRLNSLWNRQEIYEQIKDEHMIAESGLTAYELNDVFGGAWLYSEETLCISVTAPMAYQASLALTNEEMVFIRDKVFAAYIALADDATISDNLPIELIRKDENVGESLSEMKLMREVLQTESPTRGVIQFPKKRMLACILLGVALVELIVLLTAIRDDRVKSVDELRKRTDIVMIDTISKEQMVECKRENDQWLSKDGKQIYLYKGSMSVEMIELIANYLRKKHAPSNVTMLEQVTSELPQEDCTLMIPVMLMKTTYEELSEIAETVNACKLEVQAIVIQA